MKKLKWLALSALLCVTAADAIVMRHDVPDAAYLVPAWTMPAVFPLALSRSGGSRCVATLVAEQWAVTAAHCLSANYQAPAGERGMRVEIGGREAFIVRAYHHPDSIAVDLPDPRFTDIALLRLEAPVRHVAPAAFYDGTDELGQVVLFPGWGVKGNGESGLDRSDGLFRVATNRVDGAGALYLDFTFDNPGSGAALPLEGISGPGDSGGPALVRTATGWATMGVSSHQDPRGGAEGLYGVVERYTRISAQLPWLRQTMSRAQG